MRCKRACSSAAISSALENTRLATCTPQRHYRLIFHMGDGKGILWRNGLEIGGRLAFALKNYIDKGYLKMHQRMQDEKAKKIFSSLRRDPVSFLSLTLLRPELRPPRMQAEEVR